MSNLKLVCERLKQSGTVDPEEAKAIAEDIIEMAMVLVKCRDAIPAISISSARLHNIPLDLDRQIEKCIESWCIDSL